MINKDKIFNLFNNTPTVDEEVKKTPFLEDFISSPFAKIGMFTKLVLNHHVFHEKLRKFIQTEESTYSIENTKVFRRNRQWQ